MEGGGRRPGERVGSNFSAACRKLSQYIKQNRGLGDVLLTRPLPEEKPDCGRALNLIAGVDPSPGGSSDKKAVSDTPRAAAAPPCPAAERVATDQMTIFYGGKVVVFDHFPVHKANELMAMAARQPPAVPRWTSPLPPPRRYPAATLASTSSAAADTKPPPPPQAPPPPSADLPIARRVSLHRFLEKRKDRIVSKGPYHANSPSSSPLAARGDAAAPAPAPEEEEEEEQDSRQWLALGDLRH